MCGLVVKADWVGRDHASQLTRRGGRAIIWVERAANSWVGRALRTYVSRSFEPFEAQGKAQDKLRKARFLRGSGQGTCRIVLATALPTRDGATSAAEGRVLCMNGGSAAAGKMTG
jgi:hypothetical protein